MATPLRYGWLILTLALIAAVWPREGRATVFTEGFELPDVTSAEDCFRPFTAGEQLDTGTNVWDVTADSIDVVDACFPTVGVHTGDQSVDLTGSPGAGVMETSFATMVGQSYDLSFFYSRNDFVDSASATVSVIGTIVLLEEMFEHAAPLTGNQFVEFAASFVADDPSTLLRFESMTGGTSGVAGIVIDSIAIVPEPGSLVLLALGVVGLGSQRRLRMPLRRQGPR